MIFLCLEHLLCKYLIFNNKKMQQTAQKRIVHSPLKGVKYSHID